MFVERFELTTWSGSRGGGFDSAPKLHRNLIFLLTEDCHPHTSSAIHAGPLRMGVVSFWMDRRVALEPRVPLCTNPPIRGVGLCSLTHYGKCYSTA
jgi:hypothetical protein